MSRRGTHDKRNTTGRPFYPKQERNNSPTVGLDPSGNREESSSPRPSSNQQGSANNNTGRFQDPRYRSATPNNRKNYHSNENQDNHSMPDSQSLREQLENEFHSYLTNDVEEVALQHEIRMVEQRQLIDQLNEDDETNHIAVAKLIQLQAQLETFNEIIRSLSLNHSSTVEENRRILNVLKREIYRMRNCFPVYAHRSELIDKINSHRVVILKADAGSGKSTQIVQYLVDAGLADRGQIICIQHRCLTAQTLASRVANEFGCEMKEEVGYHVAFSPAQVSERTRICFATDSVLLDAYQADPLLTKYAVVVIDADERYVNSDLLFIIMKRCLRQRKDIKLVILSALSNMKLLSNYYDNVCLMDIVIPVFPIDDEYAVEDADDYVNAAIQKALDIHSNQPPGDILVFLTDPEEIGRAIQKTKHEVKASNSAVVVPLHDQLHEEAICAVFASTNTEQRKIIFTTNIAETSMAINGIRYVIDSGMVKETVWDSKRNIQMVKIDYVTQSSAQQRRSKAGRTAPGKCYHLYTNNTYNDMKISPKFDILRTHLTLVVLRLKALEIFDNMLASDWLEAPSNENLRDAITMLTCLGALEPRTEKLTELGSSMAKFNVSPTISAMILAGKQYKCLSSTLAIAGLLSVSDNIWWTGGIEKLSKQSNDRARATFACDSNIGGDYIIFLRIFLQCISIGNDKKVRNEWCRTKTINGQSLKIAQDFARNIAYRLDPKLQVKFPTPAELNDDLIDRILKCVCAGFFSNLAVSIGNVRKDYKIIDSSSRTVAQVDESSTLLFARRAPQFVLYHEIRNVDKINYLTVLCPVDISWLPETWLSKLPPSAFQDTVKSYSFENIGSALLLSIVGKKSEKVPKLEEDLRVSFEVDYSQTRLTIYGQSEPFNNAQRYLEQLLESERKKLVTEVREFEIVGSTRILLGAGAVPQLALTEDEFVTVVLTRLSTNITEAEIQRHCEQYGQVRTITMIQKQEDETSASVTYFTYDNARKAATHLSHEIWDGREINVNPSFSRPSIYAGSQNCSLKALWFMTESEGKGHVSFSQQHAAEKAIRLFKQRGYSCEMKMNATNPTIKCSWPLVPHTGNAHVSFRTKQITEQALQNRYPYSLQIKPNPEQNTSIHVQNIPREFDEDDLKVIFTNSTGIQLIRNISEGDKLKIPNGIKDDICRVFSMYRSFRRDSIQVQPKINNGYVEVYAQFSDERELDEAIRSKNGKTGLIGAAKLRLSIYEQQITTDAKSLPDDMKKDTEFVVNLSQLPPNVYEEVLDEILNQHQLTDYVTNLNVSRKQLLPNKPSTIVDAFDNANLTDQIILKSLFSSRNAFLSEPDIQISPVTNNGRGVAFIIFNDPRDVMTVMNMYKKEIDSDQLKFGQYNLDFIPNIDHIIVLNSALAQAIPHKIQQVIDKIRTDTTLSDITLRKKVTIQDGKEEISSIVIQGKDIQQITKARIMFDTLMKCLPFKFHSPSWVDAIFNPPGKKFLQNLQDNTGTYIWWNWSSAFLRIFGEDQACADAYQKIDKYIQKGLNQMKYAVYIPIPDGRMRQCIEKSKEIKALGSKNAKIYIDIIRSLIVVKGDRAAVTDCKEKIKDLLNKLSTATIHCMKQRLSMDTCPICMSEFDSPYSLQQCGHRYCRACLSDYFNTHFNSTMSINEFKLICPVQECDKICLIRDIESVLGNENMIRLATIAFQIYIRQRDNDLKQCPGINCKQVYRPSKNSPTNFCDQCTKIYCVPCEVEYHTGMTCELYQQLEQEEKDKKLFAENLGDLPFQRCPKCSTPIEKFAGCNAMKCTVCTIAFCWRCPLTHDDDVHYHYSDKNSTCYNKCFDMDDLES